MPALTAIPEALGACCATFGFNQEPAITDSINVPAACVHPEDPFFVPMQTMGEDALYQFSITFLYMAINKDTAQRELGEHFSAGSPLLVALEDCLPEGIVRVIEGRQMGSYEVGAASYFGAKLIVQVRY